MQRKLCHCTSGSDLSAFCLNKEEWIPNEQCFER